MDEFESMRQALKEAMQASKETKPRKVRPAKQQASPESSQTLTMHGGTISGVGMVGSGGTVNIIYHQQGGAQIAPAPPQERMAAWTEASLRRYEARRRPSEDSSYLLTPFPNGHYFCAYDLSGELQNHDLADFYDVLSEANIWLTDHPPFWVYSDPFTRIRISQEALDGAVESWSGADLTRVSEDPSHGEFWRVSPQGAAFMIRGLSEDGLSETPGSLLDLEQAVQRAAGPLLHAARLARALGDDQARIAFVMGWEGLKGRRLRRRTTHMGDGRWDDLCHQSAIRLSMERCASEIELRLTEILLGFLKPLVGLFGFSRLTLGEVEAELDAMSEASRR